MRATTPSQYNPPRCHAVPHTSESLRVDPVLASRRGRRRRRPGGRRADAGTHRASQPRRPRARSSPRSSAPTTPSTSSRSRCATECACTPRSTSPRTSRPYAILLQRTPYSMSPYGADSYRHALGPSERFARDGLHLRLPGRARPLSLRGRVHRDDAAPPRQARQAGRRRVDRHLGHHRVAGRRTCPTTTGASGCGASPTRASTPRPG